MVFRSIVYFVIGLWLSFICLFQILQLLKMSGRERVHIYDKFMTLNVTFQELRFLFLKSKNIFIIKEVITAYKSVFDVTLHSKSGDGKITRLNGSGIIRMSKPRH